MILGDDSDQGHNPALSKVLQWMMGSVGVSSQMMDGIANPLDLSPEITYRAIEKIREESRPRPAPVDVKISIITATLRCAETLSDCLSSVNGQTHPVREHIVIDGGSRDGTLDVLHSHRDRLAVMVSELDLGIYDALNKGIRLATGEVVGFLHGDDAYADEAVLARVAEVFTDPAVDAVYGDLVYVGKQDTSRVVRYWRSGVFHPTRLRQGWMPPHPTLYLRRSLYERHGLFDQRYQIAGDYDLMLRMLTRLTGRVVYLPHVMVRMRMGGASNRSLPQVTRKSLEDYRALRENRIGGVGTLLWKNLSKLPQFIGRVGSVTQRRAFI